MYIACYEVSVCESQCNNIVNISQYLVELLSKVRRLVSYSAVYEQKLGLGCVCVGGTARDRATRVMLVDLFC